MAVTITMRPDTDKASKDEKLGCWAGSQCAVFLAALPAHKPGYKLAIDTKDYALVIRVTVSGNILCDCSLKNDPTREVDTGGR